MADNAIRVIQGDCADVFRDVRGLEAIVADIPSWMKFMGRLWDTSAPDKAYVPPIEPRSKKHLRELQERHTFVRYWAERLAIAYDACADDAVALIWAIPKQADATMEAMRLAGWRIADTITHLFGQGWPKSKRELKPASELWILGIKGSPKLGIDACRVERGDKITPLASPKKARGLMNSTDEDRPLFEQHPLGSWPTNAVLSHFASDELTCIRDGVRRVKGGANPGAIKRGATMGYGGDKGGSVGGGYGETETLPAYRCACVCDCGARWLVLAGGDAPRCQCGRMARWACPVAALDAMSGTLKSGSMNASYPRTSRGIYGEMGTTQWKGEANEGGASRFFNTFAYFAKASGRVDKETGIPRGERHAGCEELYWRANDENAFGFDRVTREEWEGLPEQTMAPSQETPRLTMRASSKEGQRARGNAHATVKSLALMMHLHALSGATRIGDLCAGSGSGAIAALIANRTSENQIEWIGAEMCHEAIEITNARLTFWGGLTDAALASFSAHRKLPSGATRRADTRSCVSRSDL